MSKENCSGSPFDEGFCEKLGYCFQNSMLLNQQKSGGLSAKRLLEIAKLSRQRAVDGGCDEVNKIDDFISDLKS